MYKGKERRSNPRYRAGRLSLRVSSQGDEEAQEYRPDKVTALDYNANGVGFVSVREYAAHERIVMDLALDGIRIKGIIGEVRYCIPGERVGIQFDFGANEYMTSDEVINTLEEIEKKLYVNYKQSVVSSALRPALRRDRYGDN